MRVERIALVHDAHWQGDSETVAGHDPSSEAFSNQSVDAIEVVLNDMGFTGITRMTSRQAASLALAGPSSLFDGVFNLGSGLGEPYRYGQTPIFLELMATPYSGNDPFRMMICRDKSRTKALANADGIRTPPGIFIDRSNLGWVEQLRRDLFPVFVKPNGLGTSLGINQNLALTAGEAERLVEGLLPACPDGVLVESFIEGEEITVLVLGTGDALSSIPLILRGDDGARLPSDYYLRHRGKGSNPAPISWHLMDVEHGGRATAVHYAETFVRSLGLRDVNRVDLRMSPTGDVYFLECNAQPSLEPRSRYVQAVNELHFSDSFGLQRKFVRLALSRMGFKEY